MIYDENWALERAIEFSLKSKCKSQRGVII